MEENKDKLDELQVIDAMSASEASPEKTSDVENKWEAIKKRALTMCKYAWIWLAGYLVIIKEWFTGKRGTKGDRWAMAVCLLLSISVWLYVMSTNDTGFEKQLSGVGVQIEGESVLATKNMSIINGYDNNVTVTLKGKRGDIGTLTANDLHMYVDVSNINESGRYTLQVMVDLPKNSTLVSIEPSHIAVNVDVRASAMVNVKVGLDYAMDASYEISDIKPTSESVLVSGPKSVLDTIKYAGVSFNVGQIDKSMTLVGTVLLYDEYDVVISNPYVKCNTSEITVSVKVTTKKTVPLMIRFANGISNNYNVTLHPSSVTLVGDPGLLKDISELYVYTVNDGDIKVGQPLIMHLSDFDLPEGVSVVDPDRGVSINIERIY